MILRYLNFPEKILYLENKINCGVFFRSSIVVFMWFFFLFCFNYVWFFAIHESPAYGIEKILSFTIGRGGRGWSTVSLFQQVTPQVIYLWIMVLLKQRRRSRPLILVIRDPIWPRLIKSHLRRVSAVNSEVTEPMTTHNRSRVGTLPRHATILSAPLFASVPE